MSYFERQRDRFVISTDPAKLDLPIVFNYLHHHAYWALGRSQATLEKSLQHSLVFGVYDGVSQVGMARVISDYATFAYLCDVFILESHQRHGLGKWLIDCVKTHPELQNLRRWMLATRDAHGLYEQYGFSGLADPTKWMEIFQA